MSNTGPTGSLDHDRFLSAMLQLRNTPDPDCNISPAQIIFGRPLRDTFSFVNRLEKFSNPHIRPLWRQAWAAKEDALRSRMTRTTESLKEHSRPLRPLTLGEKVFLQNQKGASPTKWDRSGTVVESIGHDQYRVKVDGSGRVTLRNRRFLRAYTPATPSIVPQPTAPSPSLRTVEQLPPLPHPLAESSLPPPTPPLLSQERSTPPPHDAATDEPSPPSTGSPIPADATPLEHTPPDVPTPQAIPPPPPPAPPASAPQSSSPPARPCRARQPPKRFEPETGLWVDP